MACEQYANLCEDLDAQIYNEDDNSEADLELQQLRVLCDALHSNQSDASDKDIDSLPDFDLTRIDSDEDMDDLLRRFRRSDSFLHFHRRTSTTTNRPFTTRSTTTRSTSSTTKHVRIFSRFRSDSAGSTESPLSTSTRGRFNFFHHRTTRNSDVQLPSSAPITSNRDHRVRQAVRNFFHHSTSPVTADTPITTTRSHRVRQAVRNFFHHSTSPVTADTPITTTRSHRVRQSVRNFFHHSTSTASSAFQNLPERERTTTSATARFAIPSRMGGTSFDTTPSTFKAKGEKKWVSAAKKYLPVAIRYAKRYYKQRKQNKIVHNDMDNRYHYYPYDANNPNNDDVFDSDMEDDSAIDNGQRPTVFYCYQKDVHSTLIDGTLNEQGIGKCNIFGQVVTCPVEIECSTDEADECCEDEYGTPFCCGHLVPETPDSYYHGHGRKPATKPTTTVATINIIFIVITVIFLVLALVCFLVWYLRR